MYKASIAQQTKTASFLPLAQGMFQRKCACGNQTVAGAECAECAKKKSGLQRKLTTDSSNEPLKKEEGQVMRAPENSVASGAPPRIQRNAGEQVTESADTAPASVDSVIVNTSRQLEPILRQNMEQRFGHDFSHVRVHSGRTAEQPTREVNANAYTVEHNIIFGRGRYQSDDNRGLSPYSLHAGGGDLRSPCTRCEDEEGLKTSPLPGGGFVDPFKEGKQSIESWIVGGKETSMSNNNTRDDDDLLGSWVVGGAATPGTNTIKCDGSGGIVVQAEGTGNAAQTACLRDCIIQHEESHKTDALAANANICNGATSGNIVTVNTAAERRATEVRASNVEINCLRAKPETDACRATIADRIRQMIAYRDSF
ncbi:MAG: DUF4157 domain-containing protein [Methylobacter sp.]|jgi:hypothetical protein